MSVLNTGQHIEMCEQMLGVFGIESDDHLGVMESSQHIWDTLTLSLPWIAERVRGIVVVQGDTSSALAGALAGFYTGRAVAHVEAGLRTSTKGVPFPEEMNRRLIGQIADLSFAPTAGALENLRREGLKGFLTGNTVIDALTEVAGGVPRAEHVLVTVHRRENWPFMATICDALKRLPWPVVFPAHPNPAVRDVARSALGDAVVEPPDYRAFVRLLASAALVVTDSGGIQEEASALGIPIVVLRDESERPEAGGVCVGADADRIVTACHGLYGTRPVPVTAFGDGHAAARILDVIESSGLVSTA